MSSEPWDGSSYIRQELDRLKFNVVPALERQNADLQKANNEYLQRARDAEATVRWLEKALRNALSRHNTDNLEPRFDDRRNNI